LSKVLDNLAPKAIVSTAKYAETIKQSLPMNPAILDLSSLVDGKQENVPTDYEDRIARIVDTDPIYCIYTSGSTGIPKGVLVSHRSVADFIDWATACYGVGDTTVIGNQSPLFFDVSVLDIFGTLKTGAALHLIPEHLFSFPGELIDFLNARLINFVIWVPSVLINIAKTDVLTNKSPTKLNKVLFAGEQMPSKYLRHWRSHLPHALFSNLYGPTEATVIACYYIVDRDFAESELLPIGIPCDNVDLLVLNDAGAAVGPGEAGELYIRGTAVALGYWNDEKRTDEVFVQNPLNRRFPEKVYRTGDLVRFNERGELLFLGRRDSQIKHSGYRIELGEIEQAVMSTKDIDQASVVYDEDKQWIVLFYVSSKAAGEMPIRKGLSSLLPKYMIPTVYRRLDIMPLTPSGKIDKLALKKLL
jgi:amino acid adenylation domain-containing protein